MAVNPADIERCIREALPDATVIVNDLRGDGDHLAAWVSSASFRGKNRIEQHRMVYDALRGTMGDALHALALQTTVPEGGK